ncbi:MAG: endospore germination permease [Clostridia bacterium]
MNIETAKISPKYFVFSVICFIHSSSLLVSFFNTLVEQDSWMIVVFGTLCTIPLLLLYSWLANRFQGKNLMEMTTEIFGTAIGKMFSALYLWFFITLTALNLLDLTTFVQKSMMTTTPSIVIALVFLFVCSLSVRGGLFSITKYGPFVAILASSILIIATILSINLVEPDNLLPLFDFPHMKYMQATHIAASIPFGELIAFLMISGNVKIEPKKFKKIFIWGLLLGCLNLLILILRDTMVLGNTAKLFSIASFEVLRLINISDALSRMEVLSAVVLIMQLFFKVSFLYYISALGAAQLFNLSSFKPLIYGIGLVVIVYTYGLYDSSLKHVKMAMSVTPFFWMLFEFVIPIIMLVTALARKKQVKLPLQEDYNI